MFGFYRTMLALWVMAFHLLDIPMIGYFAVFSFFVLSGFLMTMVVQETYGYELKGLKNYAINRFLRLYPMYWAMGLITLIILSIISHKYAVNFKPSLEIPKTFYDALYNFSMIYPAYFPYDIQPRLSPPTWALTIEIVFYLFIGCGLSKTKKSTCLWLIMSCIFCIISYLAGLDGSHRYSTILGASLPFSLGSFSYHFKNELFSMTKKLRISSPLIILSLFIINALACSLISHHMPLGAKYFTELGKYTNLVLTSFTVIVLFFNGKNLFSKSLDKWLGDFSYPLYLCHWQAGLVASFLLFKEPTRGLSEEGILVFLLTLAISTVLSLVLILFMENGISSLRNRIKTKQNLVSKTLNIGGL